MASPTHQSRVSRFLFAFVLFVGFAVPCASQSSTRYSCPSEEWYNFSSELSPQGPPRHTTRQCLLSLLSDAIASRVALKTKRTNDGSRFPRILRGENQQEPHKVIAEDEHLPHVPFEALHGLLNATFSSRPVEMNCPEFLWRHHKRVVLTSTIDSDWFVSTSSCAARLAVDYDAHRWPQTLLRVECACEEGRCSARGPHSCVTVSAPVNVLRRREPGDGWRLISEPVTVGCVCASRRARNMRQSRPNLVRR